MDERIGDVEVREHRQDVRVARLVHHIVHGGRPATALSRGDRETRREEVLLLHDGDHCPREGVRAAARAGVDDQVDRPRRLESLLRVGPCARGQRKGERGATSTVSSARPPIDQSPVDPGLMRTEREPVLRIYQTCFYIVLRDGRDSVPRPGSARCPVKIMVLMNEYTPEALQRRKAVVEASTSAGVEIGYEEIEGSAGGGRGHRPAPGDGRAGGRTRRARGRASRL